ncbi:hypothetical protein [Hymenobacter persicinus]|uniref:T9SS type A sorting domain-containing protein n=1 Tax=Hymenobacter persicinus TaxID=2025506 RepID=A0A4Q5LB59_9BACT|nr:hypothetical protein [Hymenobacter persicinus]RYU78221.1 hypothetical protein EWM57_14765 [Hymenobacter persicinus]
MQKFASRLLGALLLLGASLPARAQASVTVFTEDFETPGPNGPGSFTAVNDQLYNQWTSGSAAGNGPLLPGTRAAYITNTLASPVGSYSYATTLSSIVHLYRDIVLPAGFNTFEVSFDWKNRGEATDYMSVFALPPSYVVQSSFEPVFLKGGSKLTPASGGLQGQATYTRNTYTIPNGPVLAGTTVRLVFSWVNNNAGGTQPPAALDNVVVTARNVATGLAGTYTIDNTLPASATNFPSFTAAVSRLNQALPTAPVTFNVPSGRVFAEQVPPLVVGGTAAAPVVFRRTGNLVNPVITATSGAILDVAGADYLTFDGIDVRAAGTGQGPAYGYRIRNLTPTNGVRHLLVQNATITLNRSYLSSAGVVQAANDNSGSVSPADTSGCNAHTHYHNLLIQNCYTGFTVSGYTSTWSEFDLEIDYVVVGNGTAGDIGNGTSGVVGTQLSNVRNLRYHHNLTQGLRCTGSGIIYGLFLSNVQGSGAEASQVYNNRILDLRQTNLNVVTTQEAVYGMYLTMGSGTTGSHEINVFNNEISGLARGYSATAPGTPSFLIQGIYVPTLTQPSRMLLANNTIVVDGSATPNGSSVALNVGSFGTAQGQFTLRNNLLVNLTGAQTAASARHVALYATNRQLGAPGSSTDYNNFYLANPTGGFVMGSSTASYPTLPEWQAASLQDQHAHDLNPQFASATFVPTNPALDNLAQPLAEVPRDFDNRTRSATTPDVGAFEFLATATATTTPARAELGLRAWPNPAAGPLTVAAGAGVAGQLELLDPLGRRVGESRPLPANGVVSWPRAENLPAGLYLLRLIRPDGQRQTLRVVRQ